jgi:glutamine amidotransferase
VIALIDYDAGNLTSVKKALRAIGADVFVPAAPKDVLNAHAVIVPGVGHFGATRNLGSEWVDAILAGVGEGRPLLGICLGMQWLYESSEEAPQLKGLGLLSGTCVRLPGQVRLKADATFDGDVVKVPHVGWNSITIEHGTSIVDGVASGAQVYFTHSYVAPVTPHTAAVTEHGIPFAAIVQRGHVAGVQFHPEKSGDVGLRILQNFLGMAGT